MEKQKKLPTWIGEYLTPRGLAPWIMQHGSRQIKQGISIATNSFTFEEYYKRGLDVIFFKTSLILNRQL